MLCFNCRPIVKVSDEANRISKLIENLTYLYIILAILKLFFGYYNDFLNDFLNVLMIALTIIQANFFMAGFLIFYFIFQTFFLMTSILTIIQNWYLGLLNIFSSAQYFFIFILFCSFIVNLFLLQYTFLAYREYKALYFEQIQSGNYYSKYNYIEF